VKVCLIDPILFSFQRVRGRSLKNNASMSFYPPLGLCYIANFLRKNDVDVSIVDRKVLMAKNHCGLSAVNALTEGELKRFRPDIVGITVTTPTLFDVRNNILKIVRQIAGDAMIVLGGPHASALPEDTLHDNPEVDVVCRGEGEFVMLEITQQKRLNDILGISYREGERIIINPTRKLYRNIDDFCFPARDLLDMEFYCKPNPYVMHGLYMRSTTVFTSRGCPYNCTFCAGRTA
jgi:anaerobic magnesium-protoporphyrin IX monomethyl ester cyclase